MVKTYTKKNSYIKILIGGKISILGNNFKLICLVCENEKMPVITIQNTQVLLFVGEIMKKQSWKKIPELSRPKRRLDNKCNK